jgi:hypothetical protein
MTPEQRRTILHSRHLDRWPVERQVVTILAGDLDLDESRLRNLIAGLHAPAARRPRLPTSTRPSREKYNDDQVAAMIVWYYRQAAGTRRDLHGR